MGWIIARRALAVRIPWQVYWYIDGIAGKLSWLTLLLSSPAKCIKQIIAVVPALQIKITFDIFYQNCEMWPVGSGETVDKHVPASLYLSVDVFQYGTEEGDQILL